MATTNARTASETPARMPALAQKLGKQMVSNVQQGQQLSVDAVQTWVKVISVIPLPRVPKVPGLPAVPGMETATRYTFDIAADLLGAQRDYALQLAHALVPRRTT